MNCKVLMIGLAVVVSAAAIADDHEGKSYVKFGVVNLTESSARNATSQTGFAFSYGRMIQQRSLFNTSALEIGWMRNGTSRRLDTFSLLWVESYTPENSDFIFSAGAGLTYHDFKGNTPSNGGNNGNGNGGNGGGTDENNLTKTRAPGDSATATRFALRLGVGYLVSETTSLNLDYNLFGSISGISTNRIGITATIKF